MTTLPPVQVAISIDFMKAFSLVPRALQNKVRQFVEKFQARPTAPGLNYEVIRDARDPNLRSVRVDDTYRAIVLKPSQGNVYALLWVDHHDAAYAWARHRQVKVHPTTGTLQVLVTAPEAAAEASTGEAPTAESTSRDQPSEPTPPRHPPLFTDLPDADLSRLGVPPEVLDRVRALTTETAFVAMGQSGVLPPEAHESLALWRAGFSVDEIVAERQGRYATDIPVAIDPEDVAAALDRPETRSRFRVVTDDADLARMLEAPTELWRVFLHPTQQWLVQQKAAGPRRVLGGAGTGKTVVAMHRAVHLAREVFHGEHDRIWFTTFTRNLAEDISANLDQLASGPVRDRIEVTSLDAWVLRFLNGQTRDGRRTYAFRDNPVVKAAWEGACQAAPDHLTESFVRDEFQQIVLEHGLTTEDAYLRFARKGRGTALSRGDRRALWRVFEDYRGRLRERGLLEKGDALREATEILKHSPGLLPYRAVVVDEAQDLGYAAFRLLRAVVPGESYSLFIVGDAHQRLYGHKVVLSHCDIVVRGRRSTPLRLNYRTTDGIRAWAVNLLEGLPIDDLDGELDSSRGYRSIMQGPPPEVVVAPDLACEVEAIASRIEAWQAEGTRLQDVGLVARTHDMTERYAQALEARGFAIHRLGQTRDDRAQPGLRVATMHRVKGLEFERVVVAGVNEGELPYRVALSEASDEVAREAAELAERSLLYVAVTRARKAALVTASGTASRFLDGARGQI